jgi:hypothetical protein
VPQDYVFDGLDADGRPAQIKLSELFAPGKDTLIVYSMMFPRYSGDERPKPESGPMAELPREETPCPSCTALVDQLAATVPHLEAAGFNFAVIAKAPLERVIAFARHRGWSNVRMLSCLRRVTPSSATTTARRTSASRCRCSPSSTATPTASGISGARKCCTPKAIPARTRAPMAPSSRCGT